MTVYLDVIWFLNFLFDSLLLYLTSIMIKREIKMWRVFMGGLIGSIIILLAFSPQAELAASPFVKLLFSFLMVLMTFGFFRLRFFIKALMFLYLATFMTGGALIGVHYFVNLDEPLSSEVLLSTVRGFGDPISWLFVVLGFPIAWYISKNNIEKMEMAKIQFDQLVDVVFSIQNFECRLKGLVDSGNQLYDPITKSPVMIVSVNSLKYELPKEITEMSEDANLIINGEKEIPDNWLNIIKIIPCRVVGQDHQLIIAFKPNQIQIETGTERYKIDKALISFTMQQLSSDNSFQCIVHPKMLTNIATSIPPQKVS